MSDGLDFNKIMTLLLVEEKARAAGPPMVAIRNEAWKELMKIAIELVKKDKEEETEEAEEPRVARRV